MTLTTTLSPSYTLYDYQQKMYDEIRQRLVQELWLLVYGPMRSGKSKIIASVADATCMAGKVALVLTHRTKIFNQLVEHCNAIGIKSNTEHVFIQIGNCYVAMKQTLMNRPKIIEQFQKFGQTLIIQVDEAHDGSFNKTLDLLKDALRIGYTGSPFWKDAKHLPRYYKGFVQGPQISELIGKKRFVPVDYHEMRSDLEGLKKSNTGEYTDESQDEVFGRRQIYAGLFEELEKFSFDKIAIFCNSKKACDNLLNQFNEYNRDGWAPITYYSGKPDYELAKWEKLGMANILITIRSLGTGYDHPPLCFTVLFCALGTLPGYLQIGARGCTPMDGKDITVLLDFGGNNSRFGGSRERIALTMDRDWAELWQPPKKVKAGGSPASIKTCPLCEFMLYASAGSCSNCGYIYPEAEVLLKQGELIRIQEQEAANRAKVVGRKISTLDPVELAYYAKNANKKDFAARIALSKAVEQPKYLTMYGAAIGYKPRWADMKLQALAEEKAYHQEKSDEPFKIPYADIVVVIPVPATVI